MNIEHSKIWGGCATLKSHYPRSESKISEVEHTKIDSEYQTVLLKTELDTIKKLGDDYSYSKKIKSFSPLCNMQYWIKLPNDGIIKEVRY